MMVENVTGEVEDDFKDLNNDKKGNLNTLSLKQSHINLQDMSK